MNMQQAKQVATEIRKPKKFTHVHECGTCRDSGWVMRSTNGVETASRCECAKEKRRRSIVRSLDPRFRDVSMVDFVPRSESQRATYDSIVSNLSGNFFLTGEPGVGKTHLLVGQYMQLAMNDAHCLIRTSSELMSELQTMALDEYYTAPALRLKEGQHLFWDDIDKFKVTEFKMESIFTLVNHLYLKQVGVTITSNRSLAELPFPGAVIRRLDDICEQLEVRF